MPNDLTIVVETVNPGAVTMVLPTDLTMVVAADKAVDVVLL